MAQQGQSHGVYGYRFQELPQLPLYQLFATGYQFITESNYYWDGLKRIDGPLYLIQYTVSGAGEFRLGETTHTISEGMAFLAEIPGDHHYCLPSSSQHWEFYFVLFRQQHLQQLWTELVQSIGVTPSFQQSSPAVRSLRSLYAEACGNRIENSFQASSLIYCFLMELLQSSSLQQHDKAAWPIQIRQAVAYMESDFHTLQSLDDVASAADWSKYYFTRVFTETTGISPMDYVTKLRIQKAVELLRQTELTVEQIAHSIGYSSSSYFSKVFRSKVGFPPRDFRLAQHLPSIDRLQFD